MQVGQLPGAFPERKWALNVGIGAPLQKGRQPAGVRAHQELSSFEENLASLAIRCAVGVRASYQRLRKGQHLSSVMTQHRRVGWSRTGTDHQGNPVMNPFTCGKSICHDGFAQFISFCMELLHDLVIELTSTRLSQQPKMQHRKIECCRVPVKPLPPQPIVH